MNKKYIVILLSFIFAALAVFYIVPGITHPFVSSNPTGSHKTHAILFIGLAIVTMFFGRMFMNSKKAETKQTETPVKSS